MASISDNGRIVIVGAGIIGAALAWRLASRGAVVSLLDTGMPGQVATAASWSWLNASSTADPTYSHLRRVALAEWRTMENQLPELEVRWLPGLVWDRPMADLDSYATSRGALGCQTQMVGKGHIRQLEPNLTMAPECAVSVAGEGIVEPHHAMGALLNDAETRGCEILNGRKVLGLQIEGGRVTGVETDSGILEADQVVLAAGAATSGLLADQGIQLPMEYAPGITLITSPVEPVLNGMLLTPDFYLRQRRDGSLIASDDLESEEGHAAEAKASRMLRAIRELFHSDLAIELDRLMVRNRPIPGDGFPAIGRVGEIEGLYGAVMHSGMTLAPLVARLLADEMLTGRIDPLIGPYRLNRFA